LAPGNRSERPLRDHRTLDHDSLHQRGVLRRVDDIDAAGDHGDRGAACRESALVRRRVDTPGQPRDHDQALRGEFLAEPPREQAAMSAGVSGTDDRHGGMP